MKLFAFVFTIFVGLIHNSAQSQTRLDINQFNSPYYILNDSIIASGDTLVLHSGGVLLIAENVKLKVFGCFRIEGSAINPAAIRPIVPNTSWSQIIYMDTVDSVIVKNANVTNGRFLSYSSNVVFENVQITNNANLAWNDALVRVHDGSIKVSNSAFTGNNTGEGILVHEVDNPRVNNCRFERVPDAIEFLSCSMGRISNSYFSYCGDDAIDLNHCIGTEIDSNFIAHIANRGLEIGSENLGSSIDILVHHNVFDSCFVGVNFKEGSTGLIANNTFANNITAVTAIESGTPSIGSHLEVENCILFNSQTDYFTGPNSSIMFRNCLSNTAELTGDDNLFFSPGFKPSTDNQFLLQPISICVDAGVHSLPLDPDGSVADIGAFYFDKTNGMSSNQQILVWPNPTSDRLMVFNDSPNSNYSISITDSKGKTVFASQDNNSTHLIIDVSNFQKGVFYITVNGSNSVIKSFVKI